MTLPTHRPILSISIVVLLVFASVFSQECKINELHVTLGDKFRLETEASDHVYTVGMTVTAGCTTMPVLVLTLLDGS